MAGAPGQHVAGGETPTWRGYSNRVHHGLRHGDHLWTAVWLAGLRVIDVSDPARPRTVGAYDYHPPFPEPPHPGPFPDPLPEPGPRPPLPDPDPGPPPEE